MCKCFAEFRPYRQVLPSCADSLLLWKSMAACCVFGAPADEWFRDIYKLWKIHLSHLLKWKKKTKTKPSLFFCPATGPTSSLVILKKSVTKCFLSGTRGKENRCFLCIMLLILLQRSIYRVGKYREWPASLTSLIKNIINHTYNSLNSSVTLLLYWATGY